MRDKNKLTYDKKCDSILGMKRQTAKSKLDRKIFHFLVQKCGMDKCYHCGFKIETPEELSVEHIKPWGGNTSKSLEPDVGLFWDLDNIAFSHQSCNSSAGSGRSGLYSYVGVHDFKDNRGNKNYHYQRAQINTSGKCKTLGHYNSPEEAAVAYDLGIYYYKEGKRLLNFNEIRSYYDSLFTEKELWEDFENIRSGPIKDLVKMVMNNNDEYFSKRRAEETS